MNNNQSPIEQFIQKLTEQSQAALCREEMPSEYISDLIAMLKAAIEGLSKIVAKCDDDFLLSVAINALAQLNTLATEALGTTGENRDK